MSFTCTDALILDCGMQEHGNDQVDVVAAAALPTKDATSSR